MSLFGRVLLTFVVCFALLILCIIFGLRLNTEIGTGERIGKISLLRHGGIFCTTWEGTMIRDNLNNRGGIFPDQDATFDFTVKDDALAEKVTKYMEGRTPVVLTYRAQWLYDTCDIGSGNILTDIEPTH